MKIVPFKNSKFAITDENNIIIDNNRGKGFKDLHSASRQIFNLVKKQKEHM